jgi:hypothetical protein
MKPFLFDLHCHTREHSFDGEIPAVELVRALVQSGFSGVTITDHNYVWPEEELRQLALESGVSDDFVLLSGQEVSTLHEGILCGDLLVFGVPISLPDGMSPVSVCKEAKLAGGFLIAPHPAAPRSGFGTRLDSFPVAAVEVWNGRYGNRISSASRALARQYNLPQVGGSDAHRPCEIGGGGTLVPELPRTLNDLETLIRKHQTIPWRPLRSHLTRLFAP